MPMLGGVLGCLQRVAQSTVVAPDMVQSTRAAVCMLIT
jgi:hypothetical protein